MPKLGRKAIRARGAPSRWAWPIAIGAALALAIGAVIAFADRSSPDAPQEGEGSCTPTGLHEHASFRVFVRNESVRWTDARWDFGRGNGRLAGHIHLPSDHTIHIEGGRTACTTVASFFRFGLASELRTDHLTLDDEQHGGAAVVDGQGGDLRFFLQTAANATWREAPDLPQRQPRDGDYLLVTFGTEGAGDIAWQESSVPRPDPRE